MRNLVPYGLIRKELGIDEGETALAQFDDIDDFHLYAEEQIDGYSGFSIFAGINPAVAGGFEHQGYFALIDKNGYIRSRVDRFDNPIVYYSGLDLVDQDIQGVDMLLEDVELLLKE